MLCGALGIYYYASHTRKYTVDASLMLRASDNHKGALNAELLSMMGVGGTKQTEDEVAILTSRDILYQVIKDLDLQTEYRKKDGLLWKGQYPHRDLTVVYQPLFLDTTNTGAYITLKVRKNDYLLKVKTKIFCVKMVTKPLWDIARDVLNYQFHSLPSGNLLTDLDYLWSFERKCLARSGHLSYLHSLLTAYYRRRAI